MAEKEKSLSAAGTDQKGYHQNNSVNIHKLLKDVKDDFPPHPISEIYSNPYLTEGSNGHFTTFEHDTIPSFNRKISFLLNDFEMISIDKMVILFNAPVMRSGNIHVRQYWSMFNSMLDFGRPVMHGSNKLYTHSCTWQDYFNIQWGTIDCRMPTIRLEFNPNKADLNRLAAFFACMKEHSFRFARVSRIDIAVDYAIHLNPLCWTCKNVTLQHRYEYNNEVKTRYFGSSESDLQIRIYDKAFELKRHKLDLDFDFWRIEAQVKRIDKDCFGLIDDKTISDFNPFERLDFYDPFGFEPVGLGGYKAFVYCARAYGIDKAISLFAPKTRKSYRSKLKNDMKKLSFNLPSDIYKHLFNRVYVRLVNKLFDCFEKGQGLRKSKLIRGSL